MRCMELVRVDQQLAERVRRVTGARRRPDAGPQPEGVILQPEAGRPRRCLRPAHRHRVPHACQREGIDDGRAGHQLAARRAHVLGRRRAAIRQGSTVGVTIVHGAGVVDDVEHLHVGTRTLCSVQLSPRRAGAVKHVAQFEHHLVPRHAHDRLAVSRPRRPAMGRDSRRRGAGSSEQARRNQGCNERSHDSLVHNGPLSVSHRMSRTGAAIPPKRNYLHHKIIYQCKQL